MPDDGGRFIPDPAAYAKREGIRRRMRELGIHVVPPRETIDRVIAEHEAAAGMVGHDELCEAPQWQGLKLEAPICYCWVRAHVVETVNANVARRARTET